MSQLRGDIPPELEEVVLRCLEKERDYRWSDVGTLAKQLRRFASEEGRAAVDRVIMVLERRVAQPTQLTACRADQSRRPRAPRVTRSPGPSCRAVACSRSGLAAWPSWAVRSGIGAFMAIHNLQAVLAARLPSSARSSPAFHRR